MGQIFSQLRQGQLTNPDTALIGAGGNTQFVGNPQQVQNQFYQQGAQANAQSRPLPPGSPLQTPSGPHIGTPSFQDAATAGALPGSGNALSPGLSKAGKLVTLLTGGLQGALAGRAAQEQAAVQSGGRRAGGAGIAMEAGYALPWQRAQQQAQLAQQQAQTGLLQAEQQTVNVPGFGPMPTWLARTVAPAYFRQQGQLGAADIRGQYGVQEANIGAGSRVQAAQIAQRFKAVPGMGLYDTQSRQIIPGTAQSVTITPEIAQDYGLPQDFIGKPMNVQQLSSIERAQNQQTTVVQGAGGPSLVNKRTAQTTPLGLGSPAMAGITVAAMDPNNPGALSIVPKTQAVGAQAPGSATTQAAKSTLRSATSGPIAAQSTAFQTALQHADLLDKATTALANGDVRGLNSLKNSFQTQLGSPNVTNWQAIANAYTREITAVLAKGHMTDAEISSSGATLPPNASPQQIRGAIQAYKTLAQSKMNILNQQVQRGMKGQTNFPTTPPANRPPLTSFEH